MSDVLDINTSMSIEFDLDEDGDRDINNLKLSARKHKGRGADIHSKKLYTYLFQQQKYSSMREKHYEDEVPQKSTEGWIVFVTGVHEEASEDDIYEKFSETGTVKNIRVNWDRRTGFLQNNALIEYETYEEAYRTKEVMDGTEFLGYEIKVNWCFVKGPNKLHLP